MVSCWLNSKPELCRYVRSFVRLCVYSFPAILIASKSNFCRFNECYAKSMYFDLVRFCESKTRGISNVNSIRWFYMFVYVCVLSHIVVSNIDFKIMLCSRNNFAIAVKENQFHRPNLLSSIEFVCCRIFLASHCFLLWKFVDLTVILGRCTWFNTNLPCAKTLVAEISTDSSEEINKYICIISILSQSQSIKFDKRLH